MHVLLLEPADAVREARACRGSPTAARRCSSRAYGWNASPSAGAVRERGVDRRQRVGVRDLPRLASSWPGTGRTAGSPACGSGPRSAPPRRPRRSTGRASRRRRPAAATRRGARGSPSAGRDCSVLVGMPVDGPARWTSITTIGSSSISARPIVSAFRSIPGPLVAVTPSAPPKAAPSAMPAAAISSSAWIVRTPMLLVARELVQELGRGRDRVAGEHQRQARADARGDQPERGRLRAVDVAVGAGRDVGRRVDAVLDVDQLGRLAEVPARAERGQVGLQRPRLVDELAPRSSPRSASVGRSYSHDTTPSANRFLARPASRVETPSIASTARAVSDVIGIRIRW